MLQMKQFNKIITYKYNIINELKTIVKHLLCSFYKTIKNKKN